MKKILILGNSGAGKSTLAQILNKKLNIQIIYLDPLFWKPGWAIPDAVEWECQLRKIAMSDSWIVDGNYVSSYSVLMPKADAIVVLDLPRRTSLFRFIKRTALTKLGISKRPDSPEGCPERINFEFLKYIWNFHRDRRPLIDEAILQYARGCEIRILRSRTDVSKFIHSFSEFSRD